MPVDFRAFCKPLGINPIGNADGNNGGVDIYPALRAAIDSMTPTPDGNYETCRGEVVEIPEGKWRLSQNLHIDRNMRLVGAGRPGAAGRCASSVLVFDRGCGLFVDTAQSSGTLGFGGGSEISNLAITSSHMGGFSYAYVKAWGRNRTGIAAGDVVAPPQKNRYGYALEAVSVTTGTTGTTCFDALTMYPLTCTIVGTSGNGVSPIEITTLETMGIGWETGTSITISGVLGNTNANGTHTITLTGLNTFTIAATGNGAYVSGGTATAPTFVDGGVTWRWIENHGIYVKAGCKLIDVDIAGFVGNGIYIEAGVGGYPRRDANFMTLEDIYIEACGGWGVSCHGADVNGITFKNITIVGGCRAGGVFSEPAADNLMLGLHVDHCMGPPIYGGGMTVVSPYFEGGMAPSVLLTGRIIGGHTPVSVDETGEHNIRTVSGRYTSRLPTTYANLTSFKVGQLCRPTVPNGFIYRVEKAGGSTALGATGTTGASEPNWFKGINTLCFNEYGNKDISGDVEFYCFAHDIVSTGICDDGFWQVRNPITYQNQFAAQTVEFTPASASGSPYSGDADVCAYSFGGCATSTMGQSLDGAARQKMMWNESAKRWEMLRGTTLEYFIAGASHSRYSAGQFGFPALAIGNTADGGYQRVWFANAAPGAGEGHDGDFVIRTTAGAGVGWRKEAGAWVAR